MELIAQTLEIATLEAGGGWLFAEDCGTGLRAGMQAFTGLLTDTSIPLRLKVIKHLYFSVLFFISY